MLRFISSLIGCINSGAVCRVGEFFLYKWLPLKYYRQTRLLRPLSVHLEKDIFPVLHENGVETVTLSWSGDGVSWTSARHTHLICDTGYFSGIVGELPLKSLELDTSLEANQVVELILILLYTLPHSGKGKGDLGAQEILRQMGSEQGYHKFCMDIYYDQACQSVRAIYTYCELFFSHVVSNYLSGSSRNGDHRDLFYAAPRLGIGLAVLVMALILLVLDFEAHNIAVAIIFSLFVGGIVWYFLYTIGSIRYDVEHRESLLEESNRELRRLSYFPANNPNIVIKLSAEARVLYLNPAAEQKLDSMGLTTDMIDKIMPDNIATLIDNVINNGGGVYEFEHMLQDRTYNYSISRFGNFNEAMLTATDITYLKKLEDDLRQANSHLEQKVRERTSELQLTRDVTIMTLSSLAETRDPETGEHIERTREYVRALAEYLRNKPKFSSVLDDDRTIDLLYRSAPLHDIGKVGIPDSILLKPGKLDDDEFEIMKTHAALGARALRSAESKLGSSSFLRYAREIAHSHHEKWDGTGYPQGLSGLDIPVSGRLMALADVYDALINERVYKKAFSHDKAKEIILQGRATHFDPDVVDAFMGLEAKFIQISQNFSNPAS